MKAHFKITTAKGVVEHVLEGKSASMRAQDKVTELPPSAYERLKRSLADVRVGQGAGFGRTD